MASGTTIKQMIDVVTPAAGESVTEGTILEWHVKVGDLIKVGDTIVEISTDKVDVELPSPASGTVVEILAEEGDTVGVGQVIARLTTDEGGAAHTAGDHGPSKDDGDGVATSAASSAQPQAVSETTQAPDGTRVSPVAARVAAAEGVSLAGVSGSGPGGRIVKADVIGAASSDGAEPASANGSATAAREPAPSGAHPPGHGQAGERRPLKGAAAMLARYMDESRSIPTATSFRTLTVTVLDGRRRELKAAGRRVSLHTSDRLRDRPGRGGDADHGPPFRRGGG